jgi:GNAT superfamily N-acetyltransferase
MIPEDNRTKVIKERWRRWYDARSDWDAQAREDIDFYLGNHFTANEASVLAERNQSHTPIDRLYSAIEQFKAIMTSKPPKFSAVPREDSDNKLANVWKTILEYIWDLSDGDEVFKQVVHDYAVTGLGYFYAYIDREADYGRGEVKFTYVDPFRIVVDPNSRNKWFDDSAGMMLSTILTKAQLLNMYPQLAEISDEKAGKMLIDEVESVDYTDGDYPDSTQEYNSRSFTPDITKDYDYGTSASEKYRLIESFEKVKVPYYRVVDMRTGQEAVLDDAALEKYLQDPDIAKAFEAKLVDLVQVQQTRIRVSCCVGQVMLYESVLDTDIYPIVPVPNIWTNTPYPMGDVRKNKDFQRFLNKTMSLITSHAQAASGLKLLVPQGSIQDIEELERDWANPNATIEYDASFGEPHFPSPQPLAGSILQLPQMIEHYIDLNMGIFEMQQGNAEAAPRTSSATMMLEDFGQRRSKSKLRDIEASLKRLGKVIYALSRSHYTYQKTFRIVQPNNDIDEYTVNKRLVDDKSKELQSIENDITLNSFDIRVIGNSTMPSNKWAEWNIYMEAYQAGLIDKVEALKKTDIFDKQGVLQRTDAIAKLQQQLKQAGEQIKKLKGDLQTAERESVHDKKRVEIAKFQGKLKESELESKKGSELAVGKLTNAVKLENEKLRLRGQAQEKLQKSQKKGE